MNKKVQPLHPDGVGILDGLDNFYRPKRPSLTKKDREFLEKWLAFSFMDSSPLAKITWVDLSPLVQRIGTMKKVTLPELIRMGPTGVCCACPSERKYGKWPGSKKQCQRRINFLSMLLAVLRKQNGYCITHCNHVEPPGTETIKGHKEECRECRTS